jgi:hypothetical protein
MDKKLIKKDISNIKFLMGINQANLYRNKTNFKMRMNF